MASSNRKRRIPQLKYTALRGIGWHVSYRDRETGMPRKQRFGMVTQGEAERAYHAWVVAFLGDDAQALAELRNGSDASPAKEDERVSKGVKKAALSPGSLLHIGSGLIRFEEGRVREASANRVAGTISPQVAADRKKDVEDFLAFLNKQNGPGAVARLRLEDLTMADVEAYNRHLVQEQKFSVNTVNHKMQVVKRIVDRAGRPEYGEQVLAWNWDSLDRSSGRAAKQKQLPTLDQLKNLLAAADARGKAIIWMGIGLGFGQSDLAAIRVTDIDKIGYDLRRGKTGINRYGSTPPGVWRAIRTYLKETPRPKGAELFVTRNGQPLVHTKSDSILQWWNRLRTAIGETKETLDGFYVLRHLGATEFGSRKGCSISDMKRWLGHSASSAMADVYMRPVSPEHREIIVWIRKQMLGRRNGHG